MIKKLIEKYQTNKAFKKFYREWYKANKHNSIHPTNPFPLECVTVGKKSYGDLKVMIWNQSKERLKIGNYVSIASNVTFLLGGNHHTDTIMTYPSCRFDLGGGQGSFSKGAILIEDDVWIGYGSTILSGVTIGKGAVIGAGSVVAKNVPPYAIAVGNPIQIIKFRFTPEIIEHLLKLDYSKLDKEKAKENIHLLNKKIEDISDLDKILELFTQPQIESNQVNH